jgi:hypothetical protein
MVEKRMVVDSQWQHLEKVGLENVVNQQECCGTDVYGTEILEGDEVVIDKENFEEIILKENLKRYLIEKCNFIFRGGLVLDKSLNSAFDERFLERYLHEKHIFLFMTAN